MFILIFSLLLATSDTLYHNTTSGVAVKPPFELIVLPYANDALEPIISKKTIILHHGKHLKTYVENLNRLVMATPYENMPLEAIVASAPDNIFNNAGQILNHNLYFLQFTPQESEQQPNGNLKKAIEKEWGSFNAFKRRFVNSGASLFGSGWIWLTADKHGNLFILQEPNGSNPIVHDFIPLLGFDVWEHAYYLDYENRRAEYLNALWQIVDWDVIEQRYNAINK